MTIKLDINVGDVVLGGKFKNKRMVVKKIGKDELNQPTINDKGLLKMRIEKDLPKEKQSKETREQVAESNNNATTMMTFKLKKSELKEIIKEQIEACSSDDNYKKHYRVTLHDRSIDNAPWSTEVEGFDKTEAVKNAIFKFENQFGKYPSNHATCKVDCIGIMDEQMTIKPSNAMPFDLERLKTNMSPRGAFNRIVSKIVNDRFRKDMNTWKFQNTVISKSPDGRVTTLNNPSLALTVVDSGNQIKIEEGKFEDLLRLLNNSSL